MTDWQGCSCLFAAVSNGHMDSVEILLKAGGRELLTLVAHDGTTCYDASLAQNFTGIAQMLSDFEYATREQ